MPNAIIIGPCLAELERGRDNNLNLIRVLAALGVIAAHSVPLALGPGNPDPLKTLVGLKLGTLCLCVFFSISGYLVTASLHRSPMLWDWVVARGLRLFPGLFVAVSLTALVLGPLMSDRSLAEYFSDPDVARYALGNGAILWQRPELPGVFANVPWYPVVNGSIWSLYPELICYGAVLAIGAAGLARSRRALTGTVLSALAVYGAIIVSGLHHDWSFFNRGVVELGFPFATGVGIYAWRTRLVLSWPAGLAGLGIVWAVAGTPIYDEALILAVVYWTFLLGFRARGFLGAYNRLGDYSYGLYIYAWPIQQSASDIFGPLTPMANFALSLPPTLLLAVLSWHLVEKPAIAARTRVARAIAAAALAGARIRKLEANRPAQRAEGVVSSRRE